MRVSYYCASNPQVEIYPLEYCIATSFGSNFIYSASSEPSLVTLDVRVYSDTSCLIQTSAGSLNCSTSCGSEYAQQCSVVPSISFAEDTDESVAFKVYSDSDCSDMIIATQQPLYKCTVTSDTSSTYVVSVNSSAYASAQFSSGDCSGEAAKSVYSLTPSCLSSPLYPTSYFTETYSMLSLAPADVSCFSSWESVQLRGGEFKLIRDVQLGDMVLSADKSLRTTYSPVIAIPHGDNDAKAEFCELLLPGQRSIVLTPEHLLFAGACSEAADTFALVEAKTVSMGMCVLSSKVQKTRVEDNVRVVRLGLFTIVTEEEFLVISGVMVSPYASNHALAHVFYTAYRGVIALFPAIMQTRLAAGLDAFAATVMAI